MKKQTYIIVAIIAVIVIVQLIGFLMSDTGYFFSPTIDVILGGIELFGLGIWLGFSIGKIKRGSDIKRANVVHDAQQP